MAISSPITIIMNKNVNKLWASTCELTGLISVWENLCCYSLQDSRVTSKMRASLRPIERNGRELSHFHAPTLRMSILKKILILQCATFIHHIGLGCGSYLQRVLTCRRFIVACWDLIIILLIKLKCFGKIEWNLYSQFLDKAQEQ